MRRGSAPTLPCCSITCPRKYASTGCGLTGHVAGSVHRCLAPQMRGGSESGLWAVCRSCSVIACEESKRKAARQCCTSMDQTSHDLTADHVIAATRYRFAVGSARATCTDLSLPPRPGGNASNSPLPPIKSEIAGSRRVLRIRQVSRLIRGTPRLRHPCHREHKPLPSTGPRIVPAWEVPCCLLRLLRIGP